MGEMAMMKRRIGKEGCDGCSLGRWVRICVGEQGGGGSMMNGS